MNISTVLSRSVAPSMILVFTMAATSSSTAQFLDGTLEGRINNVSSGDVFACGKGHQPCNLFNRLWPDAAPAEINGPSAPVDGWPRWRERPKRYRGNVQVTPNYPTGDFHPCEVWYSVWTGALEPDTGGFTTYYGAQSQIVGFAEMGNTISADCQPAGTSGFACFGALDETFAGPSSPPGATSFDPSIPPISGLTPVPVVSGDYLAATDSFSIAWPAVAPGNTVNLPGRFEGLCPDRAGFDDSLETNAPSAVFGVGLFVHKLGPEEPYRTLGDLEGSGTTDGVLDAFESLTTAGNGLACMPDGTGCPGVHQISCQDVTAGECLGNLFPPERAEFRIERDLIEQALGEDGPLAAEESVVFNTKVFFRGAVAGSHANPVFTQVNPSLVSPFSANSLRLSSPCWMNSLLPTTAASRASCPGRPRMPSTLQGWGPWKDSPPRQPN